MEANRVDATSNKREPADTDAGAQADTQDQEHQRRLLGQLAETLVASVIAEALEAYESHQRGSPESASAPTSTPANPAAAQTRALAEPPEAGAQADSSSDSADSQANDADQDDEEEEEEEEGDDLSTTLNAHQSARDLSGSPARLDGADILQDLSDISTLTDRIDYILDQQEERLRSTSPADFRANSSSRERQFSLDGNDDDDADDEID